MDTERETNPRIPVFGWSTTQPQQRSEEGALDTLRSLRDELRALDTNTDSTNNQRALAVADTALLEQKSTDDAPPPLRLERREMMPVSEFDREVKLLARAFPPGALHPLAVVESLARAHGLASCPS